MELRRQISVLRAWIWLLLAQRRARRRGRVPRVDQPAEGLRGQGHPDRRAEHPGDEPGPQPAPREPATLADLRRTRDDESAAAGGHRQERSSGHAWTISGSAISADAPRDSILVNLAVEDGDPARAATLANSLADAMIAASPAIAGRDSQVQQFIDADLAAMQAQIEETQAEIQRLTERSTRSSHDEQRLQALQGRIVTLRQTYATMLGVLLEQRREPAHGGGSGVAAGRAGIAACPAQHPPRGDRRLAACAWGSSSCSSTSTTPSSPPTTWRRVTGLPTLGTITKMRGGKERSEIYRLATLLSHLGPVAEAYRSLRTSIEFAGVDAPVRTLLVTSAIPGEGKTTTAANVAVVFAQAGRRTILLDADFRKPGIHRIFDSAERARAVELAALGRHEVRRRRAEHGAGEPARHHDGPLPPNPAELLGSQRMRNILGRMASGSRPGGHRQPAAPGGDGRRAALVDHRRHAVRRRCWADPSRRRSSAAARRWLRPVHASSASCSIGSRSDRAAATSTTTTVRTASSHGRPGWRATATHARQGLTSRPSADARVDHRDQLPPGADGHRTVYGRPRRAPRLARRRGHGDRGAPPLPGLANRRRHAAPTDQRGVASATFGVIRAAQYVPATAGCRATGPVRGDVRADRSPGFAQRRTDRKRSSAIVPSLSGGVLARLLGRRLRCAVRTPVPGPHGAGGETVGVRRWWRRRERDRPPLNVGSRAVRPRSASLRRHSSLRSRARRTGLERIVHVPNWSETSAPT